MQKLVIPALCCVCAVSVAVAQEITGTPGSPTATTTTGGKQLPLPEPKFGGVIKTKASESTPYLVPRVVPPKGAPNVLLIMTDARASTGGHGRTGAYSGTGAGSH